MQSEKENQSLPGFMQLQELTSLGVRPKTIEQCREASPFCSPVVKHSPSIIHFTTVSQEI